MPQPGSRVLLVLAALVAALESQPVRAATWSADATISNQKQTDITEENGEVNSDSSETFKQSYSLSYDLAVTPVLDFSLSFTLDVSHDIKEGEYDTRQLKPNLTSQLKAVWWDVSVGWSKNFDTSEDPQTKDPRDWNWNIDLNLAPKSDAVPDLKLKYKEDVQVEGSTTQKVDESWDGALDYKFWDLMSFSLTAQKTSTDDRTEQDSDQESKKYSASASIQRDFSENIKFDAKWSNDRSRSFSYIEGVEDEEARQDTLRNSLEGKMSYKPLDSIEVSLNRKLDWNSDLQNDKSEVTDTVTSKVSYDESFTETINFKVSYDDERKETRGDSANSTYRIGRSYSTSLGWEPFPFLSLSPSYNLKNDDEWADESTETNHTDSQNWDIKAESSFWDDNVKISGTRSWNKDETTSDNKWDLSLTLALDSIPNFNVSPKYSYTRDADANRTRKTDVAIKYEVDFGSVSTFSIDHTYSRSSDENGGTITRDDKTNATASFSNFFEGMSVQFNYSRSANDKNKDDVNHVLNYAYGASFDWSFLENYKYSFQYNFDRKPTDDDSQSFKNSFDANFLDGLITFSFQHEFTEQVEGPTKENHRYSFELTGKF